MTSENQDRRRWIALAALAMGVAMIIVDATIVNVALPTIIDDLGIHLAEAEWINTIYILVFASLLITAGRFGDLRGRRRLFRAGITVFAVASMLAGLSRSAGWLIGARFIQGAGGAMTVPSALSIVNSTFRGRDRGIAFGVWGSVIGGMAALGPLVGGWVTTSFSWRWAFFINAPVGVLVWIGTILWVRESRDEHARRGFDISGVSLIGTGLAGLVFALIEGPRYGWLRATRPFDVAGLRWPITALSPVPLVFALSVVTLVGFVAHELHRDPDRALIDPGLFTIRSFRFGNVVAATRSFGEFGLVFVLPLFMAGALGYSAFQIGLTLLPLAIGAFIGGPLAAYLAGRLGPGRAVTTGMFLEAVAVVVASFQLRPDIAGISLAPALFVYGLGIGIAAAQLTNVILSEVARDKSGQASGIQSTSRQIGSALGVALLGSMLAVSMGTLARSGLATVPRVTEQQAVTIAEGFRESAGQMLTQLRAQPEAAPVIPVLDQALSDSARRSGLTGAAIITIGFLMSWMLPDTRERSHTEEWDAHPS
jgi:EmrB/QacA subfamily drug resistance transporter